ncbi:MAG: hypothetical protein AB1330_11660 [Bacillota bacterium]
MAAGLSVSDQLTIAQAAEELCLNVTTVKTHVNHIYEKPELEAKKLAEQDSPSAREVKGQKKYRALTGGGNREKNPTCFLPGRTIQFATEYLNLIGRKGLSCGEPVLFWSWLL